MNLSVIAAILRNELRLRLRRLSTLVSVLATVFISWLIVADPATGRSMIVVDHTRAIYNSTALALGTSALAGFLLGLGGFYLVRGRTREDLRHGLGGVLAASPVDSATLLFARWLGAVAYLSALVLALMATVMVLQLARGEAPLEPLGFLQMYALQLLPTICMAASVAVLCDACVPLMGKLGDVLYFLLWIGQFSALPSSLGKDSHGLGMLGAIDVSGLAITAQRIRDLFHHTHFSMGGSPFDASQVPLVLSDFWTAPMMATRLLCLLLTLTPLLPAILLFHRYSPDRVKAPAEAAKAMRASPLAWLNRLLQPATAVVRPLLALATRVPGLAGQSLADIALTLRSNPLALVAAALVLSAGAIVDADHLGAVLVAAIACWGILISDIAARDYQAAAELLTGTVPGGATRRYVRHLLVSIALGLLCSASVLLCWLADHPSGAAALLTGLVAVSAFASLLGRLTRTGRAFLALFLFGLYLAVQIKDVAWFDVFGFNGLANTETIGWQLAAGLIAATIGVIYDRRQSV